MQIVIGVQNWWSHTHQHSTAVTVSQEVDPSTMLSRCPFRGAHSQSTVSRPLDLHEVTGCLSSPHTFILQQTTELFIPHHRGWGEEEQRPEDDTSSNT